MKVAAVFWGPQPSAGGLYTFGESLFDALQELAPASRHEFVYYVAGTRGDRARHLVEIPTTRRYRYRRNAIYLLRDIVVHAGALHGRPRTWFERSLAEQRIQLVWFATTYVERCDAPFVFTVFDIEHARQPWFPEVSAHGEWERREQHLNRYIRKASRVIVPSIAGREQVVHHFRVDPERVLCLPHPTSAFAHKAAMLEPQPRTTIERFGVGERYLLYPAQFWAHKNHATLLDAVARLGRDGGSPYELVLVGSDKGQLPYVQGLAREAGVIDRVHFLGLVEPDDLVALYQHAHALTYVSFFGPENLPPLEAFALGCPVIAADVPGAREQMGDAAILVAPTASEGIAEAVRRLEDADLRRRLTALGRERADALTPEAYVLGVLEFLDEFERTRGCWP